MTDEIKKKHNYPTKRMPKRIDSKYKPIYARNLASGKYFKNGQSISKAELCSKWKISYSTWKNWYNTYSDFREAVDIAAMHEAAYWVKVHRQAATGENTDANAGCIKIRMVDIESEEWTHRPSKEVENNEPIRTININILPSFDQQKALPGLDTNGILSHVRSLDKSDEKSS